MVCREVGCKREDVSGLASGSGVVLPPSLQDWLPEGHLVDFLMDAVRELDMLTPYIATQRLKHHEQLPPHPRGRIPKSLTPKLRMARTLRTKTGRDIDKKRTGQVEPAPSFGQ